MTFTDTGVILEARPHGETHAVAHIFTGLHGVRAGLVHGGQGRTKGPLLQPGNEVTADWKGRGEDTLGHFALELMRPRAAEAMSDRLALAGLGAACALARAVLPEREAHPRSYEAMIVLLDHLDTVDLWPALMARWELGLLAELGFGLSLDKCAATGQTDDLVFVSPRSAAAISREAGNPYKDRMLPLPAFLRGDPGEPDLAEALDGLRTTGFFLETRILHMANRELPEARRRVVELLGGQ